MARKPPTGDPPREAGTPPAVEVEAAIQKALEALRPRTPAGRGKPLRPAKAGRSIKSRPRPDNDA